MNGGSSIRVGFAALRANPMRAILSTLGVIFGVAALVSVLALGDGLERYGRSQISGTTDLQTLVVAPQAFQVIDGQLVPRLDYISFTPADAESLGERLGKLAQLSMVSRTPAIVTSGDSGPTHAGVVTATMPATLDLLHLTIQTGRFLSDSDVRAAARVVVLSPGLARTLSGAGPVASLVNRSIRLQGTPYTVIGILGGDSTAAGGGALVPLTSAPAGVPGVRGSLPQILIVADSVEHVGRVRDQVRAWLTARFGKWEGRVVVRSEEGRLAQIQQGILIFKLAMGALTGISLLVGGIGIMNVLLASVTERTREIGIRRAAGARARDILRQFLAEAVAITMAGSVVGVGLGLGAAFSVTALMRARTQAPVFAAFTWNTVLVAALASTAVGIVFGMYPALRAARLSPIDAIRHE